MYAAGRGWEAEQGKDRSAAPAGNGVIHERVDPGSGVHNCAIAQREGARQNCMVLQ